MTIQKSFKRLVRGRMAKTGESYAAARAALLAGRNAPGPAGAPAPLATTDQEIRRRTGLGWEQWFDLLDGWGAAEQPHRDIARRVAGHLGVGPLAWEPQAVTLSYERARGLRAVGQRTDGYAITAQKTVTAPVEALYDAFVDAATRRRWLPGAQVAVRTATRPKAAHFDWADGGSRLHVAFLPKNGDHSTVVVEHARLGGSDEAARMREYWRAALTALKAAVEVGGRG